MGNQPSTTTNSNNNSSTPQPIPKRPVGPNHTLTLPPLTDLPPIKHHYIQGDGTYQYKDLIQVAINQPIRIFFGGIGNQGKSALFKQINFMPYNPIEFDHYIDNSYRGIIARNIFNGFQILIERLNAMELVKKLPSRYDLLIAHIMSLEYDEIEFEQYKIDQFPIEDYQSLWYEPLIQQSWVCRQHDCWGNLPLDYWVPKLNYILAIPKINFRTDKYETVLARVRTCGIATNELMLPCGHIIELIDTGGERSERKKWVHCFYNLGFHIYVVNISSFSRVLWEDSITNSLTESIVLFKSLINSTQFDGIHHIVLFSHYDQLASELELTDFAQYHSDFYGDSKDIDSVCQYIMEKFANQRDDTHQGIDLDFYFMNLLDDTSFIHILHKIQEYITKPAL